MTLVEASTLNPEVNESKRSFEVVEGHGVEWLLFEFRCFEWILTVSIIKLIIELIHDLIDIFVNLFFLFF